MARIANEIFGMRRVLHFIGNGVYAPLTIWPCSAREMPLGRSVVKKNEH
jgi:hypothetical protein